MFRSTVSTQSAQPCLNMSFLNSHTHSLSSQTRTLGSQRCLGRIRGLQGGCGGKTNPVHEVSQRGASSWDTNSSLFAQGCPEFSTESPCSRKSVSSRQTWPLIPPAVGSGNERRPGGSRAKEKMRRVQFIHTPAVRD
jgi:hypothetical protein